MDVVIVFGLICAIIFIGFFSEIIFRKTNIPDVLILICLGILLGPILGYVNPQSISGAEIFTTFALAFILFQGAINIDFRTLIKSLPSTLKLTLINFLFTTIIVTTIAGLFLKYNPLVSLAIGIILGGTSSAIVIPLVDNVAIREKYGLVLTLESAISDVLCIIGTITILEIISEGKFVASQIVKTILSSFSLALLIGFVIGIIWIFVIYHYPDLKTSYIVTIAIVIGLYALIESPFVGASGAIGVLAFGLVLGNSRSLIGLKTEKKAEEIEAGIGEEEEVKVIKSVLSPSSRTFYSEISFFVKTFFFVYLGIIMDFSNPMILAYGTILTFSVYLIRPLAVKFAFLNQKLEIKEKTILEVLIPKGLAAAVLAQLVFQSGVLGDRGAEFASMILSVVFLSIVLTSILIFFTQKNWFKGFFAFLGKNKMRRRSVRN